jgi:hypothetical protein
LLVAGQQQSQLYHHHPGIFFCYCNNNHWRERGAGFHPHGKFELIIIILYFNRQHITYSSLSALTQYCLAENNINHIRQSTIFYLLLRWHCWPRK